VAEFHINQFYCSGDFSFENSPRHDAYVPKFEAELSQFCEKLVGHLSVGILILTLKKLTFVCMLMLFIFSGNNHR
jgi:hypothetical protein